MPILERLQLRRCLGVGASDFGSAVAARLPWVVFHSRAVYGCTHFSVFVLTNGTFAFSPARFIAAAAAAARTSRGLDSVGVAYVGEADWTGTGDDAGGAPVEEFLDGMRRDMADLAPDDPEAVAPFAEVAAPDRAGVPVREEVGVHMCDEAWR